MLADGTMQVQDSGTVLSSEICLNSCASTSFSGITTSLVIVPCYGADRILVSCDSDAP